MPEQTTTLRDMIQEARRRGASLRELQAAAIDPRTGKTAGKDIIASIANGTINRIPEPAHLRAIAAALHVPYDRVREAAIAQWYPAEGDGASATEGRQLDDLARVQELAEELVAQAKRIQEERREPGSSPQSA